MFNYKFNSRLNMKRRESKFVDSLFVWLLLPLSSRRVNEKKSRTKIKIIRFINLYGSMLPRQEEDKTHTKLPLSCLEVILVLQSKQTSTFLLHFLYPQQKWMTIWWASKECKKHQEEEEKGRKKSTQIGW